MIGYQRIIVIGRMGRFCRLLGPSCANAGHAVVLHVLCASVYLAAGATTRGVLYAAYGGAGADSWSLLAQCTAWHLLAAPAAHLLLTLLYYRFGHGLKAAARAKSHDFVARAKKLALRILGKAT